MVQEFTGIPTSPFTTSTSLSRRLDLFRSQKLQPQVSNMAPHHDSTGTSSSSYNNNNNNHEFENPMLSFQSLLQTTSLRQEANHDIMNKRWRGQSEKSETLGGDNDNFNVIGRSKLDINGDQVQVQGNQGSWVCPSS
ncbi:hypothetical protein QVD17_07593 [Tagetes erecta]|uniref:Uncharacterized protein n=1 Tax=Tagetes erecta TaxID=13708 RepID=A0AAD8LG48_TARER|nr:hypothetical protein QVD17_07593 [Tagetes erecta]